MMTKHYKVAGHTFAVSGQAGFFELMGKYEPFECEGGEPLFSLAIECGVVPEYTEEYRQEEGMYMICGHDALGNYVVEFENRAKSKSCLICSKDCREGRIIMTGEDYKKMLVLPLMMMYALATAGKDTVLFHAAVVSYEGKGYMFLGPSGTGKSTHASLWQRYIEGTTLVNDDNPVVHIDGDGTATVYGSPWSGKTPCYRNVSYTLGGIVMLSQAPFNKIQRLSGIHAYVAIMESISGKRWDERIADGLHHTENELASTVPMWHLECLPDEMAARLCYETITR